MCSQFLRELETKLGFDEAREHVRQASDAEFARAVGSRDGLMHERIFIETVVTNWHLQRRAAKACFRAGDLDESKRINRHEYLLLREAFVHDDAPEATEEQAEIRSLRVRAVLYSYDSNGDGTLTRAEILAWFTDLCTSHEHVARVAAALTDDLDDKGTHSIEKLAITLCGHDNTSLEERLTEQGLTTRDMVTSFRKGNLGRFFRVVYDGRMESAKQPTLTSGVQQQESGSRRRSMGSLQEGVTTASVPGYAVNEMLELSPELRAVGGWRGPLAEPRSSAGFYLAERVVDIAVGMAMEARAQPDRPADAWMPNGAALATLTGEKDEAAQARAVATLAGACKRVLAAQPTLVHVTAPAKLFGDVHGQLRDLLLLFAWYGAPTHKGGDVQAVSYVFNGDWVDRGPHQLECVLVLFALKCLYPTRIFLTRGNHEFRSMNIGMGEDGFLHEVQTRMPAQWSIAYEAVHDAFDWLPLGALVEERILVLHGGIGDGTWGLRELEGLQRPISDEHQSRITLQAVWSDPSDSDSSMRSGVHKSARGEDIPEFGPDVTAAFCAANDVAIIVRAHQYVRQGYKVMHGGRLVTLFSARNYFSSGKVCNDGALLLVAPDGNGHLRLHAKRLAYLSSHAEVPNDGDWRLWLLGSMAKCLQVPSMGR